MNFNVIDKKKFSVDGQQHLRRCFLVKKSNGLVDIRELGNQQNVFEDLSISEIQINGSPIESLSQLQNIIFYRTCMCRKASAENNKKIFDSTFDKTFE